jgi:hypothetical protein
MVLMEAMWKLHFQLLAPRLSGGEWTDEGILQFHRRMEMMFVGIVLVVALVGSAVTDFGSRAGDSFMPTVAQILPVLYLGGIVESGFQAQRLAEELPDDRALVGRYMGISAGADFLSFVVGEAAALYALSADPSTFTVLLVLGAGLNQTLDLTFSALIRSGDRLALTRMVERRNALSRSTQLR